MHPVLASFPFLSIGLLASFLLAFAALRPPLQDRLGGRGIALAALIAAAVAAAAALAGVVAWHGEMVITSYAAALVAGFAAAGALAHVRMRARGIDPVHLRPMLVLAVVLGMAGARARYAWENPASFRRADGGLDLRTLIDLDAGGMVWYGGLLLAAAGIALYAWRKRLPVMTLADVVAPPIALGLGLGRIGCFFNGCCYGRPTSVAWAVTSPHPPHAHIHPTQLYEAIAGIALAGLLVLIDRARPRRGLIAAFFCLGYGGWRFINEGLRDDYRHAGTLNHVLGVELTNSQVTSLLVMAFGLALAVWAWTRRPDTLAAEPPRAP